MTRRRTDAKSTPILDWTHPRIQSLSAEIRDTDERGFLVAAHGLIAERVRPVYAMNDALPPTPEI
ncbi:hypothetical protein [Nonomuraea soli]|uniref:Uncharacterized protein n=1 Tax=Nonomuraea soli TaxID=1032476 RepID=A0A7W0HTV7_9ACTN|nr:hypothetical protein [Nonomuraea soli]MBA2895509.1 hypothetical protein [Nonomuraea soli]